MKPKKQDAPQTKRLQYEQMARLRWDLVQQSRENWTLISLSVVAACAWLLVRGHSGAQGTPLAWASGALSLLFGVGWAMGHRGMMRTQSRLAALEEQTGCRARFPLLRTLRSSRPAETTLPI